MNVFRKMLSRAEKKEMETLVKKTVSNFLTKMRKRINDSGILDRKLLTYKEGFMYAMQCFCAEANIDFDEIMKNEVQID
jgi:site-specific recombinase XerD